MLPSIKPRPSGRRIKLAPRSSFFKVWQLHVAAV
jgi:hypothetical protein